MWRSVRMDDDQCPGAPMMQAILFDLGDTLLHFETADHKRLLDATARPVYAELCEMGYQPPAYEAYSRVMKWQFLRAYFWSRVRRREVRVIPTVTRAHESMRMRLNDEENERISQRAIPVLRQFFTKDAHANEMAAKLADDGYKLGIVSNTVLPGKNVDDFLERVGLLSYFPVRVYSSEVGFMKPDRRIFHIALEEMGVAPSETVFVGDRLDNDVGGASRMGMKTILVVHGEEKRRRWARRPDHVVYKLSDIPAIVRNLKVG